MTHPAIEYLENSIEDKRRERDEYQAKAREAENQLEALEWRLKSARHPWMARCIDDNPKISDEIKFADTQAEAVRLALILVDHWRAYPDYRVEALSGFEWACYSRTRPDAPPMRMIVSPNAAYVGEQQ